MGEPITVLCVDDDPELVELTATFLERAEERVRAHTAGSADEGLTFLAEDGVDCIVSDYEMPGCDGLAFLESVRAEYPDLPFLLFTGRGSEEIASEAISAGVTDYMQKEGGTDQYAVLARRVRNAVEHYRAREAAAAAHERAKTILEASPDAIVVSIDDEYVYANRSAAELFDASDPEELVGLRIPEVVHPAERDAVSDALRRAEPGEFTVNQAERTLRSLRGRTFPAEVTGRGITWDGEQAVVAIIRDVSERTLLAGDVRAEREALRELYALTAEGDPEVAALVDLGRERLSLPYGYFVRDDGPTVVRRDPDAPERPPPREACERTVERGRSLALVADGEGTYLGAPVYDGEERVGVLCFSDGGEREEFSKTERAFAELLALWVGFAAAN